MPLYRKIATRLHPRLMSFLTGTHVTRQHQWFQGVSFIDLKDERIDLDQPWLNAYELEPYLMFKIIRLGYKFTEVFVTKIYPAQIARVYKNEAVCGMVEYLRPLFYLGFGIKK